MNAKLYLVALMVGGLLVPLGACGKKTPAGPSLDGDGDAAPTSSGGSEPIPADAGAIEGVIKFKGTAPKPRVTDISGSDGCGHDTVESEEVVVNENGTLRWAIAHLETSAVSKYKFDAPKDVFEVDQKGCVYIPHVAIVRTGQPFAYKNSDGALHNVHTLPKQNPEMNVASPVGTTTRPFRYRKEEILEVKCDVHPWMSSFIGVFAHPYYAVTGEEGTFKLDKVPPGTYKLQVWHEKFAGDKPRVVEVTVKPNETAKVELTIEG